MKLKIRTLLLAAIFSWCLCSRLPAATIILVRHAERTAGMSADALLSPAGEERAALLSVVLKDAAIRRIFVTEVRRTQQTAEPTARRFHLQPVVIAQKDTDALVNQLKALGEDEPVLVIGHANTVPLIVDRLGGGPAAPMADSEYDRLTIIFTGAPGQKTRVLNLRYGKTAE